jgi:hypothetical protein
MFDNVEIGWKYFACMGFAAIATYIILRPDDLVRFAMSVVTGTLIASIIVFYCKYYM